MKRILIISFSDLKKDPRVFRQIKFLKDNYSIYTIGFKSSGLRNVDFYPIESKRTSFVRKLEKALLLKFRLFETFYWDTYMFLPVLDKFSNMRFDLIIANDIDTLPLALKISNGAKILFDAHEYSPKEFEDKKAWRFFFQEYKRNLCKKYIPLCDKMITVSDGISEEYYRAFGVKPVVITNACDYANIRPSPVIDGRIKMIHHGGAIPCRKIESMIELMNYLDERFTLDLLLAPNSVDYMEKLKNLAKNKKNVRFLQPVPLQKIVELINLYDLGLYILEANSFNNKYALPNKFFEFVQARLAIAIGPSPEMAKLVKKYDCGIVSDSFKPEDMAKVLTTLTKKKIDYFKNKSNKAAHNLSSSVNMKRFELLIKGLLQQC